MARTPTIKDETIIEAARAVFLSRGFRATTAEVAEHAGISEGSIFNRFKSKVELFQAAIQSQLEEPEWIATLDARVGQGDVEESLADLARQIIAFARITTPLLMMSWSNPGPNGVPCHMASPDPPPARAVRRLASYFEAEIAAGRIRRVDPEVLARTFLGGLHNFVFFEILNKMHDTQPGGDQTALSAEAFVRGHVGLLWTGIAPRP